MVHRGRRDSNERSKLRRQIAFEAARLMYQRQESEYYQAKMKAGRRICRGWVKDKDLPSNAEIRDEIQKLAHLLEGEQRLDRLQQMRVAALRMMKLMSKFRPKLIGSVLTGHIRNGSDVDLHLFSNSFEAILAELDFHGLQYDTEIKRVLKHGERQVYRHVHVFENHEFEFTVYPEDKLGYVFKSSITGKAIERASISQLEQLLELEYPDMNLNDALAEADEAIDRFQEFYSLLLALEEVKQHPKYHPEGDALYHSLQVFDLACDERPYDEEFLLAALLHDVGKALDPYAHVESGLEALTGLITERTAWLIAHHMEAHKIADQTIGARARRRLEANENYEDLLLLGECDRGGRCQGVRTTSLEDALDYIRSLAHEYG